MSGTTPLELRNKLRVAQRTVRLALNSFNSNIDAWKAAIDQGKGHATGITNAILMQQSLPQLPLGVLSDHPSLLDRAQQKLLDGQRRLLLKLEQCLSQLESAVAAFTAALDTLTDILDSHHILDAKGNVAPVFTALPLTTVHSMLEQIRDMHSLELEAKITVYESVASILQPSTSRLEKSGSNTSSKNTNSVDYNSLQVHIVAWMLCPRVDDQKVSHYLGLISQDAGM